MTERQNGLTYAAAGVDIDAGNALVEAIKPLAKATRRPGAEVVSLGGLGAVRPARPPATWTRCWSPPPTASAPS